MFTRLTLFCILFVLLGTPVHQAREQVPKAKNPKEKSLEDQNPEEEIIEQEKHFLDTSPQEIYGLHTTTFSTPYQLKFNYITQNPVEISIEQTDRFTWRQKYAYKLQDLGGDGTASKYIFYQIPQEIGYRTGFYVYDLYFSNPWHQKYYDAKAPYTDGTVSFGNYGCFTFDVIHARSFNRNWHCGIVFDSMLTDREFIPSKIPYDRQIIAYGFTCFGNYTSTNKRYRAHASFYRKNHRSRDTGGIDNNNPDTAKKPQQWLGHKASTNNNLLANDEIESNELRQQYFFYHQVTLAPPLQVYNELLISNSFNHLVSKKLGEKSKEFLKGEPAPWFDKQLKDETNMQTYTVEAGIKTQLKRVYTVFYHKEKYIHIQQAGYTPNKHYTEPYLGLYSRINLRKEIDFLHLHGEYLEGDFYKVRTAYQGKYVEIAYDQVKYRPSFLSQQYYSPFRKWRNDFKPTTDQQLELKLHIPLPGITISPYGRLVQTRQPIYFQQKAKPAKNHAAVMPVQAKGVGNLLTYGTTAAVTFLSVYHVDTEILKTDTKGKAAECLKAPKLYTNVRCYYADTYKDNKAAIETGIEWNWKSGYTADAYDPITQQFYVQNTFPVYGYPVIELFFNFKIHTFRGFVKVVHLNQGFPAEGYFVTPFYPGQIRSIDFGVSWALFD